MTVGVAVHQLHLSEARSLKEKRMVLSRLKGRLQRLNVSIAEVEHQDLWQRTALAVACVGSVQHVVEATLRSATAEIEHEFVGEILDVEVDFSTS